MSSIETQQKLPEHPIRILATGFEPFRGSESNVSELATHILGNDPELAEMLQGLGATVATEVLPVRFADSKSQMDKLIATHEPNIVLMFGQAPGSGLRAEPRARNVQYTDFILGTNKGDSSKRERFVPLKAVKNRPFGAQFESGLPYESINKELTANGNRTKKGQGIGTFVCNALAAHYATVFGERIAGGFIHIGAETPEESLRSGLKTIVKKSVEAQGKAKE